MTKHKKNSEMSVTFIGNGQFDRPMVCVEGVEFPLNTPVHQVPKELAIKLSKNNHFRVDNGH